MFEEALAKHGIPQEMKYLAVIESALNPSAISPAGAGGLWQFMVATGKMYGLEVNSYQDDRFDPIKSTEAACKYLKFLYNTFGDWQLALAAYNSGPGNVNKAIRRAGGKRDFWEIKNFLPKETQGYVPAFIAVNYVMNYSAEHNLFAKQPMATYFEVDTLVVNERIDFNALSRVIGMSVEEIAFLNPTYKLKEIPDNGRKHYIYLPVEKTGLFIANEDLVYEQSRVRVAQPEIVLASNTTAANSSAASSENAVKKTVWENQWKSHSVKRGESLGKIADKYDVSLAELKKWNKIKGSKVVPGQKLKVQTRVKKTILVENNEENVAQSKTDSGEVTAQQEEERSPEAIAAAEQEKSEKLATPKASAPKYKYYTVQPGDTLWKIANKHDGVSMDQIKTLNKGLKENKLAVGQKIKIKQIN
jgi:membrane-bound lytic murein transglycosylase D